MQGAFVVPAEARLREFVTDKDGRFIWNEAVIALGDDVAAHGLQLIRQHHGRRHADRMGALPRSVAPRDRCRNGADMVLAKAPLPLATEGVTRVPFKGRVSLRGTGQFAVQSMPPRRCRRCSVRRGRRRALSADVLPLNSTVSADGFEAKWQTTEFGSPRITTASAVLEPSMWNTPCIGVDLIQATPIYRMINRVAKYGLLFIVLSFATYFFFEVLSRLRIHVVQYGLLGLSLSLFSLLLLSLAEPIGYTNGYLVAAGLVLAAIHPLHRGGRAALHAGVPLRLDAREPVRVHLRAARARDVLAADRRARAVRGGVGADGAHANGQFAGTPHQRAGLRSPHSTPGARAGPLSVRREGAMFFALRI